MSVDDVIKVHVPGERPWAKIVGVCADGRIRAVLLNDLVGGLFQGKWGDEFEFVNVDGVWEVALP